MSAALDQRLQRLLGGDHLAALRRRLRRRFERHTTGERFRITGLTPDEHAALAALLGRPPRSANSMEIDLGIADAALRQAGIAASLRAALERIDGPIADLAAERARLQARWSDAVRSCRHPDLAELVGMPSGLGLLKRLSDGDPDAAAELCRRAEAVLLRLPASGVARAQLAAEVLGEAHALDAGRPEATLVLAARRLAVAHSGRPAEDPPSDTQDSGSLDDGSLQAELPGERARDIWARAGVLVNELARPALFLNLPTRDAGHAQRFGEPGYISLRALLRSAPCWAVAGRDVYVCENPNLIAIAADRLGRRCPPMASTDGMPAAAQRGLLAQLAQAGARLHYHGDFDWPGVRIGGAVMREYGARPWRFGADDYLAAVRSAPCRGHLLTGPEVLASWDEELTSAMKRHRLAIAEEAVAAVLLRDLDGDIR